MTLLAERVRYYGPFTHYAAADLVRMTVLAWSLTVAASVLLVAWRRWAESRISASLFLIALTLAFLAFGAAGLIALGRPPIWWYLGLELIVLTLTTIALFLVVREAKQGIWARRQS